MSLDALVKLNLEICRIHDELRMSMVNKKTKAREGHLVRTLVYSNLKGFHFLDRNILELCYVPNNLR